MQDSLLIGKMYAIDRMTFIYYCTHAAIFTRTTNLSQNSDFFVRVYQAIITLTDNQDCDKDTINADDA